MHFLRNWMTLKVEVHLQPRHNRGKLRQLGRGDAQRGLIHNAVVNLTMTVVSYTLLFIVITVSRCGLVHIVFYVVRTIL